MFDAEHGKRSWRHSIRNIINLSFRDSLEFAWFWKDVRSRHLRGVGIWVRLVHWRRFAGGLEFAWGVIPIIAFDVLYEIQMPRQRDYVARPNFCCWVSYHHCWAVVAVATGQGERPGAAVFCLFPSSLARYVAAAYPDRSGYLFAFAAFRQKRWSVSDAQRPLACAGQRASTV